MADKPMGTSVDEVVHREFKAACVANGFQMKTVLEAFMKAYAAGRFKLEIEYEAKQTEEK